MRRAYCQRWTGLVMVVRGDVRQLATVRRAEGLRRATAFGTWRPRLTVAGVTSEAAPSLPDTLRGWDVPAPRCLPQCPDLDMPRRSVGPYVLLWRLRQAPGRHNGSCRVRRARPTRAPECPRRRRS